MESRVCRWARPTAIALTAALLAGLLPASALADDRVRCESSNFRYNYCRFPVREAQVVLVRDWSRPGACRDGFGWGYDRRGIWVDHGCRAEFEVRWGGGGRHDDDHDNTGAVIAGVAIGAVILGALIASSQSDDAPKNVPSWAVGSYVGYSDVYGEDVSLTIDPAGAVTAVTGMGQLRGTWVGSKDQVAIDGRTFEAKKAGSGIRLTDLENRDNVVTYARRR